MFRDVFIDIVVDFFVFEKLKTQFCALKITDFVINH